VNKLLIEADYSQIEIRVITHLSRCCRFIDIFLRDSDPHTETAAQIFGIPSDEAQQMKYRYPAKRANFGIIYGITPEGLAADIEESATDIIDEGGNKDDFPAWSVDDCSKLIKDWNKLYPGLLTPAASVTSRTCSGGSGLFLKSTVQYVLFKKLVKNRLVICLSNVFQHQRE